jgi:methanogenic corrinoid protein MtbC1
MDLACRALAEAAVALLYERDPAIITRYPPGGREKCIGDTVFHIQYLRAAAASRSPSLFRDYVAWAKMLFASLGLPLDDLRLGLACLAEIMAAVPGEEGATAAAIAAKVATEFDSLADHSPALLTDSSPLGKTARDYLDALLSMDRWRAEALVMEAFERGTPIRSLYLDLFQPVMREVGRLWHANRVTVAQEHYVSAATQMAMSRLYPSVFAGEKTGPVVLATCVSGELHEIGMRMVADLLELEGCQTHYVGANAPPNSVVDMAHKVGADVVAISATISANVPMVSDLIGRLRKSAGGDDMMILVGGYPFNVDPGLWRAVGADAMASDAAEAVTVVMT